MNLRFCVKSYIFLCATILVVNSGDLEDTSNPTSYLYDMCHKIIVEDNLNMETFSKMDLLFLSLENSDLSMRYELLENYKDVVRRRLLTIEISSKSIEDLTRLKNDFKSKTINNLVVKLIDINNFFRNIEKIPPQIFIMELDTFSKIFSSYPVERVQLGKLEDFFKMHRDSLPELYNNIPTKFYKFPMVLKLEVQRIMDAYGYHISVNNGSN